MGYPLSIDLRVRILAADRLLLSKRSLNDGLALASERYAAAGRVA